MPDNQQSNIASFGFVYFGIVYIWYKKELYRQPYSRNSRYYNERKLKPKIIGLTIGYVIDGNFKSMKNLKEITKRINYIREVKTINDCPF